MKGLGSSWSIGGGVRPSVRSAEAISLSGGEFRPGGVCPQDSTILGPDNWTGGRFSYLRDIQPAPVRGSARDQCGERWR